VTNEAARRPTFRPFPGIVGLLLLAAAVVEIVLHGGAAMWTALLGLVGPDFAFFVGIGRQHEPGQLPRVAVPVYNLLHWPWLPLIMLAVVTVDDQTNAQAAPYLVGGLAWLAHIALDRALGFNLRARDGSIRG
jgi:hypothetical protein